VTAELPCLHQPLNGAMVCKTDRDGVIEWQTNCFLSSVGSHDATIQYKSVGGDGQGRATALLIHGNPSKFLQGHNIFGSDDLLALVFDVYQRICRLEGLVPTPADIQAVLTGQYSLRRLDINYSFELPSRHDVLAWLRAAEYCSRTRHGRPATKGGTLYWGKNSKRWSMKAYSKGEEIGVKKKGHQLPLSLPQKPLLEWADNKLRIELVLRGKQLDEMGINQGFTLNQPKVTALFNGYLEKITMTKQIALSDKTLIRLPANLRSTYILWKEGHDLRSTLSRATYYRHRKELLLYSIDIAICRENSGQSNVIPLVRVLEATPARVPAWAFDLGVVHSSTQLPKAVGHF